MKKRKKKYNINSRWSKVDFRPLGHCRSVGTTLRFSVHPMICHFFSQGTGINPLDHKTRWLYTAHRQIEMMSQHVEWIRASDWSINWPPFLLNLVHPLRTSSDLSLSWHTEKRQRFKTVNGQPSVSVILYTFVQLFIKDVEKCSIVNTTDQTDILLHVWILLA